MLSNAIRDKSAAMYDGSKLFIQMFSAVVGGSVLLRLQNPKDIPPAFVWLSNCLVVLVATTSAWIIVDHYRSWRGYRRAQSKVAGAVPGPPTSSAWTLAVMLFVMAIALFGFIEFNTFSLPGKSP